MNRFQLAATIVFRPAAGWAVVDGAVPTMGQSLLGHVLPLALLPAVAWPLGTGAPFLAAFAVTLLLSLATVLLFALALYVLSPFFDISRHGRRCVALASYASTPMFLAGALLIFPVLVVASIGAAIHSLVLCYLGAQQVLGCKEDDAAAFVVVCGGSLLAASTLLGGLCSAAGLI